MTRQLSNQAAAAKMIRQELKKAFPKTKFSVTSSSYSMGDSVRIDWTNGPTTDMVNGIARKYQYGSFNGMEDIYEYSNSRTDIPQTKYVQLSRDISEDLSLERFEYIKKHYKDCEHLIHIDQTCPILNKKWSAWTARNLIYRDTVKTDLTNGWQD